VRVRQVDLAGGDVLLELLEGAPARLGHPLHHEAEGDDVQDREGEEGSRQPQGLDDLREEQTQERVRHPQHEHRDAHAERPHALREDLGEGHPGGDVQAQLHRADEEGDQAQQHEGLQQAVRVLGDRDRGDADEQVEEGHQAVAPQEGLAAAEAVHHLQGDDRGEHGDRGRRDVGDQGTAVGESGLVQHLLAVVEDRVDTGGLLEERQAAADQHDLHEVLVREDLGQAHGAAAGLGLLAAGDVGELGDRPPLGAQGLQDRERLVRTALGDQPARRLRQTRHAQEQQHRRDAGEHEHHAPDAVELLAPQVADDRVDDDGGELAGHDHHLVASREGAADLVGGELGEVDGHHHGGGADGEPEHDAARDHRAEARRADHDHDADQEHQRHREDGALAADGVGDAAAGEGADGRGEQQRADGDAEPQGVQAEVLRHEAAGAVDDARVVAEQQPAEGGDERDLAEPAAVGPRGEGREVSRAGRCRRERSVRHRDSFVRDGIGDPDHAVHTLGSRCPHKLPRATSTW
jgi:hypothetical protein